MNATILVLASILMNGQVVIIPSETGNPIRCEMMKKSVFDLIEDHGDFLSKTINYNTINYKQDTKTLSVYCVSQDAIDAAKKNPTFIVENYRDLTK